MTNKKRNALLSLNTLIWAGLIFAPVFFPAAFEAYTRTQVVLFAIIGFGWFVISAILTGASASARRDFVLIKIKKLFGNSSGRM